MRTKKTAKNKRVKEQPTPVQTAAIAAEQYKRTESGFVLVKTAARNGSVTEIPLSNFSAEIVAEKWREGTAGCVDWVLVRVQFEGKTKDIRLSAQDSYVPPYQRSFDDRLVAALKDVHPRIIIYPGKTNQVLTAIKTLSKPRVIESDNNKNNKQTDKE